MGQYRNTSEEVYCSDEFQHLIHVHQSAMTTQKLITKASIAAELADRDHRIILLQKEIAERKGQIPNDEGLVDCWLCEGEGVAENTAESRCKICHGLGCLRVEL